MPRTKTPARKSTKKTKSTKLALRDQASTELKASQDAVNVTTIRGLKESTLFLFLGLTSYLILALLSYSPTDPAWSHTVSNSLAVDKTMNLGGHFGALFADVAFYLFGYMAYFIPILLAVTGWVLYKANEQTGVFNGWYYGLRIIGFILTVVSGCAIATMHFAEPSTPFPSDIGAGGILGQVASQWLQQQVNFVGATLSLLTFLLIGITLFSHLSWFWLMDMTGALVIQSFLWCLTKYQSFKQRRAERRAEFQFEEVDEDEAELKVSGKAERVNNSDSEDKKPVIITPKHFEVEIEKTTDKKVVEKTNDKDSIVNSEYESIDDEEQVENEQKTSKLSKFAQMAHSFKDKLVLKKGHEENLDNTDVDEKDSDNKDEDLLEDTSIEPLDTKIEPSFGNLSSSFDDASSQQMQAPDARQESPSRPPVTNQTVLSENQQSKNAQEQTSVETAPTKKPKAKNKKAQPIAQNLEKAEIIEDVIDIPAYDQGSQTWENYVEPEPELAKRPIEVTTRQTEIEKSSRLEQGRQTKLFKHDAIDGLPSISLLDEPKPPINVTTAEELEATSRLIEQRLAEFNMKVQVVAVQQGPVITRFELDLAPGTKVSQLTNLSKDLARSLLVVSIRVVEVIAGKSTVGVEIPNQQREYVYFSQVLNSSAYGDSKAILPLALGHDISGQPVVTDLAKMPHVLVAGTTGSGKSVGVNSMILSMLFKSNPDELRLIMVDPKMLELSIYEGIPHLLAPVVVDMNEAANALRWCVGEMERRYKLLAAVGVRNIAGYNKKVKAAAEAGEPLLDPLFEPDPQRASLRPDELETLPYIVIIIDEFADMMMIVGKKVEELIARLAQKARAAGIHLILATQRPSVNVVTGLIKANVPTRIAFQVSTKIDSRTILDQMGAETLLGNGDMLYLPPGSGLPQRVHGAFVSDEEVHAVVDDIKSRGHAEYIPEILSGEGVSAVAGIDAEEKGEDGDPLYDQAVALVIESRRASISSIQRRLKVGYNRAARMVEDMEAAGLVSAVQSNGQREVLVPPSG